MTRFRIPRLAKRLLGLASGSQEPRQPLQPEVLVVSYPKTGRTWLRMMLGRYLCLRYSLDGSQILDSPVLTNLADLRITRFVHDGSNLRKGTSFRDLNPSKLDYRSQRVLLLTRSIEDSMVSAYFQLSSRLRIYQGSISEFLRDERYGVEKFVRFYRHWHSQRDIPERFQVVTYEQMQADAASVLKIALSFINESPIDDHCVREAVDYCSFDSMRAIEQSSLLAGPMQATNANDPNSRKVRRGVVGGYVDYLKVEDLSYIRQVATEANCPFVTLCPHNPGATPKAS